MSFFGAEETGRPDLSGLTVVERDFAVATADTGGGRLPAISALLRRVREIFKMDVVFVSEFTQARRVFRHVEAAEAAQGIIHEGGSDPLEESYCMHVVEGRLPNAIPDAMSFPATLAFPATKAIGIGAHLSVPIRLADGHVFGTLCCFSRTANSSLGASDVDALQSVAVLLAKSLEKSRSGDLDFPD